MNDTLSDARTDVGRSPGDRPGLVGQVVAICAGHLHSSGVLHQLGVLATRNAEDDAAITCFTGAIGLDSGNIAAYTDLAVVLTRTGRLTEALAARLRALTLASHDPELYSELGRTLATQNRFTEARAVYVEALRIQPVDTGDRARVHAELGDVLSAQGQFEEALEHYHAAQRLTPSDCAVWHRSGQVWLARREWEAAAAAFRHGLELQPDRVEFHLGLGLSLSGLARFEEAAGAFRSALALDPANIDAARHLALILERLGRTADAGSAWALLGKALGSNGCREQAAVAFRQALARTPDDLRALFNMGKLHLERREPRQAIPFFEAALALDSDQPRVHVELGRAYHNLGDHGRGLDEFGWGYTPSVLKSRGFSQPVWDGSPLEGRTILLWAEPALALGDTIQFLRYVEYVKAGGGRVVIECARRLVPLVAQMPCVDCVIPRETPLPSFSVHAPLGFLPNLLRKRSVPLFGNVPYLTVADDVSSEWRRRLQPDRKRAIGIVWSGKLRPASHRPRVLPLAAFAPLGRVPGVRFISLQFGPLASEVCSPPAGLQVESLQDESCSIVDTAALVLNLDLVITVDTMIAHLAGALAKPVWTLLWDAPSWRWSNEGDQTPWYPTMRLFRQSRKGDWASVFELVKTALGVTFRGAKRRSPN